MMILLHFTSANGVGGIEGIDCCKPGQFTIHEDAAWKHSLEFQIQIRRIFIFKVSCREPF